jgi:predicted nuclease of restriction endonuclease-like RecB superfamily
MLTADLLRARVVKGEVRPRYVDPADPQMLQLAGDLASVYAAHLGKTRGVLQDALAALQGESTDYLVHRGLAKLLDDRSTFAVDAPVAPEALRQALFEAAARSFPPVQTADAVHPVSRADVVAAVAAAFGVEVAAVERAMYADLEDETVLTAAPVVEPAWLLHRYNTALAQAVLLRASRLVLDIAPGSPQRYRQMFRWIKFYRLMHTVEGSAAEGFRVTLDGPLSLFQLSHKYGLQLAEFLPALLLGDGWRAEAEVLWGTDKRPLKFVVTPDDGLVSHYPDTGAYITQDEQFLAERLEALGGPWTLDRRAALFDLGGRGVLVPEFALRHKDDQRVLWVELVGFWRKDALEARVALLQAHGPGNLLLLVPHRLRGSEEALSAAGAEVMVYKDVIVTKELLARAERLARVEPQAVVSSAEEAPRKPKRAATKRAKKA